MTKGVSSGGSLKALAHPIQQFLAGWGVRQRTGKVDGAELPAPYQLAALRGEGVLRERFFGAFMQKLPVQLDAAQQLALWHSLVQEGGQLTAWVQRLGMAKALRREAVLPEQAAQESRLLYSVLLQALTQEAPHLLPWAVEGFFYHVWKQQFGTQAPAPEKKATQADVLREQLTRALRKQHGQAVTVKESYKQEGEQVLFALLYKTKAENQWRTLVRVQRPRLKTARVAAYETALTTPISKTTPSTV